MGNYVLLDIALFDQSLRSMLDSGSVSKQASSDQLLKSHYNAYGEIILQVYRYFLIVRPF